MSDPEQNPRNPILIKDEKDFLNFIASFKTCYLYCGVCLFLTFDEQISLERAKKETNLLVNITALVPLNMWLLLLWLLYCYCYFLLLFLKLKW